MINGVKQHDHAQLGRQSLSNCHVVILQSWLIALLQEVVNQSAWWSYALATHLPSSCYPFLQHKSINCLAVTCLHQKSSDSRAAMSTSYNTVISLLTGFAADELWVTFLTYVCMLLRCFVLQIQYSQLHISNKTRNDIWQTEEIDCDWMKVQFQSVIEQ